MLVRPTGARKLIGYSRAGLLGIISRRSPDGWADLAGSAVLHGLHWTTCPRWHGGRPAAHSSGSTTSSPRPTHAQANMSLDRRPGTGSLSSRIDGAAYLGGTGHID